jgi:hypothetical protein
LNSFRQIALAEGAAAIFIFVLRTTFFPSELLISFEGGRGAKVRSGGFRSNDVDRSTPIGSHPVEEIRRKRLFIGV